MPITTLVRKRCSSRLFRLNYCPLLTTSEVSQTLPEIDQTPDFGYHLGWRVHESMRAFLLSGSGGYPGKSLCPILRRRIVLYLASWMSTMEHTRDCSGCLAPFVPQRITVHVLMVVQCLLGRSALNGGPNATRVVLLRKCAFLAFFPIHCSVQGNLDTTSI